MWEKKAAEVEARERRRQLRVEARESCVREEGEYDRRMLHWLWDEACVTCKREENTGFECLGLKSVEEKSIP